MRIDHIALFCRDLVAMRQFFLDYFEAVSNEQYHNPRTGLRTYILSFTDGSTRLELMQRPDVADADPSVAAIGYIHISIAVGSKRYRLYARLAVAHFVEIHTVGQQIELRTFAVGVEFFDVV